MRCRRCRALRYLGGARGDHPASRAAAGGSGARRPHGVGRPAAAGRHRRRCCRSTGGSEAARRLTAAATQVFRRSASLAGPPPRATEQDGEGVRYAPKAHASGPGRRLVCLWYPGCVGDDRNGRPCRRARLARHLLGLPRHPGGVRLSHDRAQPSGRRPRRGGGRPGSDGRQVGSTRRPRCVPPDP